MFHSTGERRVSAAHLYFENSAAALYVAASSSGAVRSTGICGQFVPGRGPLGRVGDRSRDDHRSRHNQRWQPSARLLLAALCWICIRCSSCPDLERRYCEIRNPTRDFARFRGLVFLYPQAVVPCEKTTRLALSGPACSFAYREPFGRATGASVRPSSRPAESLRVARGTMKS